MSTIQTPPNPSTMSFSAPVSWRSSRAAGFQSAKPSVVDAVTDMAAKHLYLLAETTARLAAANHRELEISMVDLRMAMEEEGAIGSGKSIEDQIFEGQEDLSGIHEFIDWCNGPVNQEIKRVAKDTLGEDGADYVTALKRKQTKTNDDTRYHGTILGKPAENRPVVVEGGPVNSINAWHEMLRKQKPQSITPTNTSRRASSTLTSLEDEDVELVEFDA